MKYRKKPIVIEAELYELQGDEYEIEHARRRIARFMNVSFLHLEGNKIKITTLEGPITADVGDYIIKGIKGEFYPCKPDIFKSTYESIQSTDEVATRVKEIVNAAIVAGAMDMPGLANEIEADIQALIAAALQSQCDKDAKELAHFDPENIMCSCGDKMTDHILGCPKEIERIRQEVRDTDDAAFESALDKMSRDFRPAESSRGQGGLPLYGSVKSWELHLTKEGWEWHKAEARAAWKAYREGK